MTLHGQISHCKTEMLSSNQLDEQASVAVIVDEIWNTYDFDRNGTLDKAEILKFIDDFLPQMVDT